MRPPPLPRRSRDVWTERPAAALAIGIGMIGFSLIAAAGCVLVLLGRGTDTAPLVLLVASVVSGLYGIWFTAWARTRRPAPAPSD